MICAPRSAITFVQNGPATRSLNSPFLRLVRDQLGIIPSSRNSNQPCTVLALHTSSSCSLPLSYRNGQHPYRFMVLPAIGKFAIEGDVNRWRELWQTFFLGLVCHSTDAERLATLL